MRRSGLRWLLERLPDWLLGWLSDRLLERLLEEGI